MPSAALCAPPNPPRLRGLSAFAHGHGGSSSDPFARHIGWGEAAYKAARKPADGDATPSAAAGGVGGAGEQAPVARAGATSATAAAEADIEGEDHLAFPGPHQGPGAQGQVRQRLSVIRDVTDGVESTRSDSVAGAMTRRGSVEGTLPTGMSVRGTVPPPTVFSTAPVHPPPTSASAMGSGWVGHPGSSRSTNGALSWEGMLPAPAGQQQQDAGGILTGSAAGARASGGGTSHRDTDESHASWWETHRSELEGGPASGEDAATASPGRSRAAAAAAGGAQQRVTRTAAELTVEEGDEADVRGRADGAGSPGPADKSQRGDGKESISGRASPSWRALEATVDSVVAEEEGGFGEDRPAGAGPVIEGADGASRDLLGQGKGDVGRQDSAGFLPTQPSGVGIMGRFAKALQTVRISTCL